MTGLNNISRLYSSSKGLIKPSYFAFVDTNVILGYLMNEYSDIKEFIDSPHRKFFYTETVKAELTDIPKTGSLAPFHFVKSGLEQQAKETAIKFLYDKWEDQAKKLNKKHSPFVLTKAQKTTFHNDLFIIFEAGFAKYSPDVLPESVYQADLITNNLKLYRKFIQDPATAGLMEKVINLCGFEHLIKIEPLKEAIHQAVGQKKTNINPPSTQLKVPSSR